MKEPDYYELWQEYLLTLDSAHRNARLVWRLQKQLFELECDLTAAKNDLAIATFKPKEDYEF